MSQRFCNGKIKYVSEHKAKKARNAIENKRSQKLRIYPCTQCYGYHLTSQEKRPKPTEDRKKRRSREREDDQSYGD